VILFLGLALAGGGANTPCGTADCSAVVDLKHAVGDHSGGGVQGADHHVDTSHSEDVHDDGHHADSGKVAVDARSLFQNGPSVDIMRTVLRGVANEPGERGYIDFILGLEGKIGTGAVNAEIEGEGDLTFQYSMDDQNLHILEVDLELAGKLGVNFLGIASVGGVIELEGDFVKVAFASSEDAARWLTEQLDNINKTTGNKIWKNSSVPHDGHHPHGMHVTDRGVAVGAYTEIEAGPVEFEGEVKVKRMYVHYHGELKGEEIDLHSVVDHKIGTAELTVPIKGREVTARYEYDKSWTTGSPFQHANGTFVEHTVDIELPTSIFEKRFGKPHAPRAAVQDAILNTFAAIEKLTPGSTLKGLNYKMFEKVANDAYHAAGKSQAKFGIERKVIVTLNWHQYGENDGTNNLMYFRAYVGGETSVGGNFDAKAVEVTLEAKAGKTEMVWEQLGTNTISYVNRQFLYQNEDRPWAQFESRNRGSLKKLVANLSQPGHTYYSEAVAQAYNSGGYEAGLKALTDQWAAEEQNMKKARAAASELALLSNKWQTWWGKDDIAKEAAGVIFDLPFEVRPYAWDLVDDFGGDPSRLESLAWEDMQESSWLYTAIYSAKRKPPSKP